MRLGQGGQPALRVGRLHGQEAGELFEVREEGTMSEVTAGLMMIAIYLTPSFVSAIRKHPNANPICVLNILLGWTFIGWVIAMVWSLTVISKGKHES